MRIESNNHSKVVGCVGVISLVLYLMLFFPSITFGIIPADIFPWGLLFVFSLNRYNIHYIYLLIIFIILSFIYFLYIQALIDGNLLSKFMINSMAALNAILPIYVIIKKYKSRYEVLFKALMVIYHVLMCIAVIEQFFGGLQFLIQLKALLVPNGWWGEIGAGRGISLLSTEPSRASIEVAIIYSVLWFHYRQYRTYLTITFIIIELVLLKSMSGAIFCVVAISVAYPLTATLSLLTLTLFLTLSSDFTIPTARWLIVFKEVWLASTWGTVFDALIVFSGTRIISLVASVKTLFYYPLGLGFGGSRLISDQIYETIEMRHNIRAFTNKDFSGNFNIKPSSFFSSILMELGAIGIMAIMLYVRFIAKNLKQRKNGFIVPVLIISFSLLFLGPVGSPIPFTCLGLAILFNQCDREKVQ